MRYFLTLFAFLPCLSFAFTLPGSEDYKILDSHSFKYIYSPEYAHLIPELVAKEKQLNQLYQTEFRWELDEKAYVILTSPNHQIANGFATVIPLVETVFFPGGTQVPDFFAAKSWLETLLIHEVNHLYQLNVKPNDDNLPKIMKSIFGNAPFVFLGILPIFPQPNIFLPGYLTEGGATYNEARFGSGGRLYNGAIRAQVYATLREQKQPYEKVINSDLDFPLDDDYIIGAYLAQYKADQSMDSGLNNLFFQKQSSHYINPFILDSTYRDTYDLGYEEIYSAFISHYQTITAKQKYSQNAPITSGLFNVKMNKINKEIVYLNPKGLDEPPELVRYNLNTGKVSKQEFVGPAGKVFVVEGEYFTSSATRTDVENFRATLVGDGHSYREDFLNKSVLDIKAGHTAYFPADKSFDGNILMVNDKNYGVIHSSAILDDSGQVYYFKQEQDRRVLFRNNQRLTSFKSYWSIPVEVIEGDIYFIAPTEYGSTLFKFNGNKITRMSSLDTITEARLIDNSRALISEVTGRGYEQKVVELSESDEQPILYDYHFAKESTQEILRAEKPDASVAKKAEDYSSFSEMRYSNTSGVIGYGSEGPGGSLVTQFTDPMLWQSISLGIGGSGGGDYTWLAQYTNNYYRLSFYLGYLFSESVVVDESDKIVDSYQDRIGFLGFSYPLFNYRLWQSALNIEGGYENDEDNSHNIEEFLTSTGLWRLSYGQSYGLGFSQYRYFSLQLGHRHKQQTNGAKDLINMSLASSTASVDLGYQNYLTLSGVWGYAQADAFEFTYRTNLRDDPFMIQRIIPGETIDVEEIRVSSLKYKKALNYGLYFTSFPISLRRFAPFLQASYYDLREEEENDFDENFAVWGGGIDFEFLLFHKIPFRYSAGYFEDNLKDEYMYRMQITF